MYSKTGQPKQIEVLRATAKQKSYPRWIKEEHLQPTPEKRDP